MIAAATAPAATQPVRLTRGRAAVWAARHALSEACVRWGQYARPATPRQVPGGRAPGDGDTHHRDERHGKQQGHGTCESRLHASQHATATQ